jgi:hypothetical protein
VPAVQEGLGDRRDGVGTWTCGGCVDSIRVEARMNRMRRTLEAREAIRGGREAILVPGMRLPPATTDEEAQRIADEEYGIKWSRKEDEVIIWVEM